MYTILINGMPFDRGKSGVSDYIKNVSYQLALDNRVELILLEEDAVHFTGKPDNLKIKTVPGFLAHPLLNMLWCTIIFPFTIQRKAFDFLFLPAGNRRLCLFYPLPTITTFHDLSQFHVKNKYGPLRMFYIKQVIPGLLKKTDAVIAVSNNTKKDIVEFYRLPGERITVSYNGVNLRKYPPPGGPAGTGNAPPERDRKQYLLYIARIEHPGKNHLNLIKAYEMLPRRVINTYDLVLAGTRWSGSEAVFDYINDSPLKEHIKLPGFVPDEHLLDLFKNASLYVFPSFYEGFGIPIIEAFACGVPVVCANTSSLPEIGGDGVVTFSPHNPEDIKDKIVMVLEEKTLQKRLIEAGTRRLTLFSWKTHKEKIIEVYEKLKKRN